MTDTTEETDILDLVAQLRRAHPQSELGVLMHQAADVIELLLARLDELEEKLADGPGWDE